MHRRITSSLIILVLVSLNVSAVVAKSFSRSANSSGSCFNAARTFNEVVWLA
ncbi:hypothetical protein BH20ACI3_BH20ACI3_19410 [soil metagenome]